MILSYLSVQNFSVIDDVELDLEEGLNIFTGEQVQENPHSHDNKVTSWMKSLNKNFSGMKLSP